MTVSTDRSLCAVYDPSVIAEYVEDDAALAANLRGRFIAQVNKELQIISQAIKREDWERLLLAAHKLKSTSKTVGALALADYCERLDQPGPISAEVARKLGERLETGIVEVVMKMRANLDS